MDLLCFCSVLCLLSLCVRLYICALWSPAGKGLTSWLSFVVSYYDFITFPLVSCVRCGTWLYRFLIFAALLTLYIGCEFLGHIIFTWDYYNHASRRVDTIYKLYYQFVGYIPALNRTKCMQNVWPCHKKKCEWRNNLVSKHNIFKCCLFVLLLLCPSVHHIEIHCTCTFLYSWSWSEDTTRIFDISFI